MGKTAPFDKKLLEFATDRERVLLETWANEGTQKKAARVLQITQHSISNAYKRARSRAEIRGYSPQHGLHNPVPGTQLLKGASTLYDEDGKVRLQWVKSSANLQAIQAALHGFAAGLADDVRGGFGKVAQRRTRFADAELATHYKIGDQHLGLYAWGSETGSEDYDLAKSSADIVGGLSFLIDAAPPTQTGVLVNVGDFLHANDRKSQTPGSGNLLDVDGRHGKVARRAAHILRDAVRLMLHKHQSVQVINARGNHDPDAAVSMEIALEAYFEKEPRVTVQRNDCKVQHFQWGSVCHFVYHGERNRQQQLAHLTNRYREQIGKSAFVYVDNGHVHHKQREELGPCQFEVWNPLAASDQYHADALYGASRSITSVIYHKQFGEVSRNVCDLRIIRAEAD